jgi:hypothetical protein
MLSMKLFVAHILRRFELSTSMKFEEIEVDVPIILKIRQGYKISIRSRTTGTLNEEIHLKSK